MCAVEEAALAELAGAPVAMLAAPGTNLQLVECATIESAGNCWQQRMHLIGRLEHRAVCVESAACGI